MAIAASWQSSTANQPIANVGSAGTVPARRCLTQGNGLIPPILPRCGTHRLCMRIFRRDRRPLTRDVWLPARWRVTAARPGTSIHQADANVGFSAVDGRCSRTRRPGSITVRIAVAYGTSRPIRQAIRAGWAGPKVSYHRRRTAH